MMLQRQIFFLGIVFKCPSGKEKMACQKENKRLRPLGELKDYEGNTLILSGEDQQSLVTCIGEKMREFCLAHNSYFTLQKNGHFYYLY